MQLQQRLLLPEQPLEDFFAVAATLSKAGLLELPLSTSWQPGTSFMAWTADRWGI